MNCKRFFRGVFAPPPHVDSSKGPRSSAPPRWVKWVGGSTQTLYSSSILANYFFRVPTGSPGGGWENRAFKNRPAYFDVPRTIEQEAGHRKK